MTTSTTSQLAVALATRGTFISTGTKTPASLRMLISRTVGAELADDDQVRRTLTNRADFATRFKALASNDNVVGGNAK